MTTSNQSNTRLLAVVPAYNEQGSVATVVEQLFSITLVSDVVVIDDGSTDQTSLVARSAGAQVIRHIFNLGIGGAVQSGFIYAAENGFDMAIQVDGDGQHEPTQIDELFRALELNKEIDVVVGSRFLSEGGDKSTHLR